jgi:plasmid maintenance system killer protein
MRVDDRSGSGLERIDGDPTFDGEFEPKAADEIRHRLKILRDADSEEPLLALRALQLERRGQTTNGYTMRVTDELLMDLEFDDDPKTRQRCVVIRYVTSNDKDKKGDLS